MKENKDQPIYPCLIKGVTGYGENTTIPDRQYYGLSKREYFAGLAFQGLMANPSPDVITLSEKKLAEFAILYADALLNELSKPTTEAQIGGEKP